MKYGIAVIAGFLALAAAGAAGAQDSPRTLELVSVEQRCGTADNGRRGDSLGDLLACRGSLRENGRAVGHVHWTCVYLGAERRGEDCTATVNLAGGTLQLAGVLSHMSPRSTWAIAGGTGDYAGARGIAELRQLSATRTGATLTLLP
jgi:dirigent-like protein